MKNLSLLFITYLLASHSIAVKAQVSIPYLSILSPSSIVKTYYQDSSDFKRSNGWGAGISKGNIIASAKIPNLDPLFCADDKTDFTGQIAIITRGTCEFGAKALKAQNNGAIAVIIVNFENAVVTMGSGAVGSQVTIPVLFIKKDLGDLIIRALEKNEDVVLSLGNIPEGFGFIHGYVQQDLNSNCESDTSDIGLLAWDLNIEDKNGNSFKFKTNKKGYFNRFLSPDFGPYKLKALPPNPAWNAICDLEKEAQVKLKDTLSFNFLAQSNKDCVELHTDISALRLRRCFDADFVVKVCNAGTVVSKQSYVDIGLTKEFGLINNASLTYSIIGANLYRFQLGEIEMNDCKTLHFKAKVLCDSVVLGQTLCYYAQAYPDTTCTDVNPAWSGADIKVKGQCLGSTVEFIIKNEGKGNMNLPGNYVILKDDQLYQASTFQLFAGQSKVISLPANGTTWHLEATQESGHQFSFILSKTVEACSMNNKFTTGFASMFPPYEEGFSYDEECLEVIGSYDPNDKAGFPNGFGPSNLIKPNAELEYFIRFQNTGTDTAFTVRVEDILPLALDPLTVYSIVSSHDYVVELLSNNRLIFIFNDIKLVDSFANEPASHGFVSFKIKQKPNNPDGTFIDNIANIYFDFNAPVLTNFVFHEVGEFIGVKVATKNTQTFESIHVYPNPGNVGSDFQLTTNEFDNSNWSLVNVNGQKVCVGTVKEKTIKLPGLMQQKGFYLLEIQSKTRGKVIKKLILI